MNYKQINKYNIEQIKDYYEEYLQKMVREHYSNYEPYTFGEFIENELTICEQCGEVNLEDEMRDTTEMVNGGIGFRCEQCIEDL